MAGLLSGEPSNHGSHEENFQDEPQEGGGRWYFSRKEIEENSPSRRDGIDLKKETYLRKSYCTFLQDLGMRLKVPQVTIATAIIFCHRFFLRQSHAKNDRRTIATVCMFLAGKVEETPRPLKDVIIVSYEIIHKKDTATAQRIKQKEVYEQQKEIILLAERVVLATLGFDFNVNHPYKPLVEAIKKFQVAQQTLAQVAWNFVNDGLRTSICLQFKPHHIAAGATFLAAKFLKVKLPTEPDNIWWQEFDVNPRQLEDVSNQMLELYEQNKPPPQANEAEGSSGGSQRPPPKGPPVNAGSASKAASLKPPPSRPVPDQPDTGNPSGHTKVVQMRSFETNINTDQKGDDKVNEGHREHDQEGNSGRSRDNVEQKDKYHGRNLSNKDVTAGQSPQDAMKKLDKEKLKAAFEKRKARGEITRKMDPEDELERELEDVEVPGESEKIKGQRKHSLVTPENENQDTVEEGELEPLDDADMAYRSPKSSIHKRKAGSPLDHGSGTHKQNRHDYPEDRNGSGRVGYSETDHKRHVQENHV
ncbi:hypothetical protein BUALT_Bualt02G0012900 [Buddleja alternifolia]|uniref:Cyclin-like domain-containing protein n=1 Tax=Buddleja alternifolia TaxID=168488 RepID=A0AAV6XWN0_9LAMI|nr:hypothetical protein BUALT_Bualt02G0012900 [Buddleja alternifolia]